MKYILIIFLYGNDGTAIDHISFNSLPACQSALKEIQQVARARSRLHSVCVAEG